jgi:hypothetical protein
MFISGRWGATSGQDVAFPLPRIVPEQRATRKLCLEAAAMNLWPFLLPKLGIGGGFFFLGVVLVWVVWHGEVWCWENARPLMAAFLFGGTFQRQGVFGRTLCDSSGGGEKYGGPSLRSG